MSLTVILPHILTVESTWNSFSHYVIVYITCVISKIELVQEVWIIYIYYGIMVCVYCILHEYMCIVIVLSTFCQQIYSKLNSKAFCKKCWFMRYLEQCSVLSISRRLDFYVIVRTVLIKWQWRIWLMLSISKSKLWRSTRHLHTSR